MTFAEADAKANVALARGVKRRAFIPGCALKVWPYIDLTAFLRGEAEILYQLKTLF